MRQHTSQLKRLFQTAVLLSSLLTGSLGMGAGHWQQNLVSQAAQNTTSAGSQSGFSIDFLDVGQADAAVITCDGQTLMIDGGNAADSSLIYSYLKGRNLAKIDSMICTHPHEDHAGGLSGALNAAAVGTAYAPFTTYDNDTFNAFTKYLAKQGKLITVPKHGDTFSVGSATVSILGPIYPELATDLNNTSIVARVQYGNTSFLFTGDAGVDEELEILGAGYDVSADVLKVGHHGSSDSTCQNFLKHVNPKYAVISCGANNSYGHPKESVINELKRQNVTLYRTDMQGTITCTSDGTNVSIQTERNSGANTLVPGSYQATGSGSTSGSSGSAGSSSKTLSLTNTAGNANSQTVPQRSNTGASYILNTNTHKFHYPSCSSVSDMKEKNKKASSDSREAIIAQGYSPCGRCKP